MDSETIVESSFEYTDGKMYRTIKVTMPPCDTNDDAAWAERNDLAERIRALLQAPTPQPPVQGAVAYVTGYYGGRCVVKPVNNAAVLPTNMALYTAPHPSDDVAKDAWIPVGERLPEYGQEVIVNSNFDGVCAGVLDSYDEWFAPCSEYKLTRITHWMPLPAAPAIAAALKEVGRV